MRPQTKLFNDEFYSADTNPNDIVFTPDAIAKMIVDEFRPYGRILEPCKGGGAFMRALPNTAEWCEINEGRDFFKFNEKVDWLVSNPPYSTFDAWLEHSFNIADNVAYLVPFSKIFKSMGTVRAIFEYGGIVKALILPAGKAGFPFGFPCGAFHFKRGYRGETTLRLVG